MCSCTLDFECFGFEALMQERSWRLSLLQPELTLMQMPRRGVLAQPQIAFHSILMAL